MVCFLPVTACSVLADSTVFMSFLSCGGASQLASVSRAIRLPVIGWDVCEPAAEPDWMFTMTSSNSGLPHAIKDIIVTEGWDSLALLYDGSADQTVIHNLVQYLGQDKVRIVQFLSELQVAQLDFRNDHFFHQENFLVYCSEENVMQLLEKARLGTFDVVGPIYKWLIIDTGDLDIDHVTSVTIEGDNVAILQAYDNAYETLIPRGVAVLQSVIQDLTEEGYNFSHTGICPGGLQAEYSWVLRQKLQEYHNQTSFPECLSFRLLTLSFAREGRLRMMRVGQWSEEGQLTLTGPVYPQVAQGYNNRTFLVTTVEYDPFMIKHANGTWSGVIFDLLDELSFAMNFSYTIHQAEDNKFGIDTGNGTFNGMIGEIQRKDVDFGVAPFSIVHERDKVVDFTTPFWDDPYIILIRRPNPGESLTFICLGPFSTTVWMVIGISVIVTSIVLWVSLNYYPKLRVRPELCESIKLMKNTTWQTFGALLQQGMVDVPVITSGRVIVAMWWFYVIVIAGVYNGNLIAFLTAPKTELPINSLSDLVSSDISFGTLRDAAFHGILAKGDDNSIYQQLWDKVKDDTDELFYVDTDKALMRVLNDSKYAFIIETTFYTMLHVKNTSLRHQQCDFARPDEKFLMNMYAFAFQENSPYTAAFSMQILRVLESGLLERIKHKWLSTSNRCTGLERRAAQTNIGLQESQGAFYILAIGVVSATLVLLFENFSQCVRSHLPQPKATTSERCGYAHSNPEVSTMSVPPSEDSTHSMPQETTEFELSDLGTLSYVNLFTGKVTHSELVFDPGNVRHQQTEHVSNGVIPGGSVTSSTTTSPIKDLRHRARDIASVEIHVVSDSML